MTRSFFLTAVFILLIHATAFFLIKDHGMMMDEHYHYKQIQRFLHGNYTLDPELPMAPGYHAVIAAIARVGGMAVVPYYPAVPLIRGISWLISLLSIWFFFLCARLREKKTALVRTLLYSVFPIFFPFFSLIYTDLMSVTVLLIAYWLLLSRRYGWAGLIATLSIPIRQNNIVWAAYFVALLYVRDAGWRWSKKIALHEFLRSWSFLLAPVVFVAIIWYFGGVSSGKQTYVAATVVVPKNLFLFLFLSCFFFLPAIGASSKNMIRLARQIGWWWALFPIAFFLFNATFYIEHPYNHGSFFVHNAILEYFTANWQQSLMFFLVMTVTLLYGGTIRFAGREDYVLYPFIVLFFLPLFFIEQRYTMIPFALLLLMRRLHPLRVEYSLIAWNLLLSGVLFWGMWSWRFFW